MLIDFATNVLLADVANFLATWTTYLVATIQFDKRLFAFRTMPNLRSTDCLFYFETPFIFYLLFGNLLASQGNMSSLPALATGLILAANNRTFEHHLSGGHICFKPAFWASAISIAKYSKKCESTACHADLAYDSEQHETLRTDTYNMPSPIPAFSTCNLN